LNSLLSGRKKTQCYSHKRWTNEWGPDTCLGRHSKLNAYDLPYVWISEIEEHIERYYRTIKLDVDITTTLYGHLMKAAKRRTEKARQMVDD
jgi:hypothetical protein